MYRMPVGLHHASKSRPIYPIATRTRIGQRGGRHFPTHFRERKYLYFHTNFFEFQSLGLNKTQRHFSKNILAPKRCRKCRTTRVCGAKLLPKAVVSVLIIEPQENFSKISIKHYPKIQQSIKLYKWMHYATTYVCATKQMRRWNIGLRAVCDVA